MGFLGVLVQFLLKQNAQRHDEHVAAIGAINQLGLSLLENMNKLHRAAMDAIASLDREHREHREKLHAEATAEIVSIHKATAALSERTAVLETKAELREAPCQ